MPEHGTPTGYSPRLRLLIASALALAIPVVVGAAVSIALDPPGAAEGLAIALFLGLALLAELKPVPLEEDDLSTVSLAFVFILAAVILFGWEAGVVVAAVSALAAQLAERKPLVRTTFNTAVYSLSAFAAAAPVLLLGSDASQDPLKITLAALVGGAAFVVVNFAFISLAISFHQQLTVVPLLREEVRLVGPAFTIQALLAALAAALWATDARLLVLMAGPLFTVTLYQRSSLASRRATRDAHTDSLTRIGNNRAYELGLGNALASAAAVDSSVTLCLVDVDDFKQINDAYGHPLGDQVLVEVAQLLRAETDCVGTFRFGGDEFAVILACGKAAARAHVAALHRSLPNARFSHGDVVTVSVGTATFPADACDQEELEVAADCALYWAKQNGKNRSCAYDPAITAASAPAELERRIEYQARLRAAENLIRIVDAKDEYMGAHSERVALLVEAIARLLACDEEQVEQLKVAGRLHDLGKISIPDSILQKPDQLTREESRLLAHHPELGASVLEGMDIRPVDVWIRHHHEHWDGSGYPHGLAGEEIPFGSRVILVADAYDAITTERSYRAAVPPAVAIAEIRAHAGIQFDPLIVAALEEHLETVEIISLPEFAGVAIASRKVA